MSLSSRTPTALAGLLLVLGLAAPATAAAQAGRITNISTRGQVLTGNDVMIGGFVIEGASSKTVVVRARGPSLVPFGIANALANPTLRLVRSSDQTAIADNDDWGAAANATAIAASGFAPSDSHESAILANLAPGAYTAIVSGAAGGTGVGIVEVFALDAPSVLLSNISTRGRVLAGNDVMIGGFVVEGGGPQSVVVRARGPSLTTAGISNALANPSLQIVRSSDQAPIASSADWGGTGGAAAIAALGLAPANALESAVLATLDAGAYTAIVSGADGGTGVGIVEVFAVDGNRAKSARLIGGTWTFSSSLGVNGYTLTAVGSSPDGEGGYAVSGTTDSGQPVSGGFSPPDAKWDLLQQGSSSSFYYTFDFVDDDHISGCHYEIQGGSTGPCVPLTGSRASTTPPPPPPGPVIPPGCSTGAHHYGTFRTNGQKIVFGLAPGETAAAALPLPSLGSLFEVNTTETVNTPPDADHQVTVSKCPGDFTPAAPCMYQAFATGSNMFTIGGSTGQFYQCKLEPGVQYFMNVRQVVRSNTSLNSCSNPAGCEIRVQIQIPEV